MSYNAFSFIFCMLISVSSLECSCLLSVCIFSHRLRQMISMYKSLFHNIQNRETHPSQTRMAILIAANDFHKWLFHNFQTRETHSCQTLIATLIAANNFNECIFHNFRTRETHSSQTLIAILMAANNFY